MRAGLHGVALAVLAALPSAYAQQAVDKVERIEVTGSRIATSSDVESASPIAVIKAEDIKLEGFQSIELILNNYPQFAGDQGNRISNGATGTATANLRALGAQRTLTLLNGKRLPAGSPFLLAPDLNQIPTQLIQRVEVLTGGASAVYGSDAIAGVVNFILNDHFEGVQGDVAYDFYNHQQHNALADLVRARNYALPGDKSMDGSSTNASLTIGGNFAQDKGNAVVSFRYFDSQALLQSERDYSACALVIDRNSHRPACGGSQTGFPGSYINFGALQPDLSTPIRNLTIDTASGRVRDYTSPADDYNYAPLNYYQRPQQRYGFNAFVNYDVTPEARAYAEFGYHDDHTHAQLAPSGFFGDEAFIRWENPLLTNDWRSNLVFKDQNGNEATGPGTMADVIFQRRNVDGSGRVDDIRLTSFREVLGVKGTAGKLDYDTYFQTSRVNYNESFQNAFSRTRALRSLDVVVNPTTGAPTCASVLDGTDPNCVPFNIWSPNPPSSSSLAYLNVPGFQTGSMTQQVIGGTITANLGDFGIRVPGSRRGVEIALGAERRSESLDFRSDTEFATHDLEGAGSPIRDVKGAFVVKEAFGEIRIPVLDVANLSGSYRRSNYDTGVATDTFGAGFNATPTKILHVRGSFQRAVRAPDLQELFSPQFPNGYGLGDEVNPGDPCEGLKPLRSLGDCQRTGVTAANYGRIVTNPFNGYPSTAGGNPGLNPETAKTYTLGLVLAPTRDLSLTVDYFDIRIEKTISSIPADLIFYQCLDTGDPFYCSKITRDPATGALWLGAGNIFEINQNIGKTRVAGTDVAVNYRLRLPQGHNVLFDGMGTYLQKQSVEAFPGAEEADCAGFFQSDCANIPLPRWRHRLRVTWQPPSSFELAATWRYIHETRAAPDSGVPVAFSKLPSISYIDLAGSWSITKQVMLRGGVNNVADRDPPLTTGGAGALNGNAYAQIYDVLGRHVFVSLSVKF